MKDLKRILAENMIRFGTKNLNKKSLRLIEQSIQQQVANAQAQQAAKADARRQANVSGIKGMQTSADAANQLNTAKESRPQNKFVTYIRSAKTIEKPLDPMRINALFYNNMVSIDQGLMDRTNVDTQINELVASIKSNSALDPNSFVITVTGTATSAAPKPYGFKAPNQKVELDHPGTPYDGIDISKPENHQKGNEYLAKQRAESIVKLLDTALKAQGITAKFKTASKVLPGTVSDDEKRFIDVNIIAREKTKEIETKAQLIFDFTVTYESGQGLSNAAAVSNIKAGIEGGTQQAPSNGYKANVVINFGQQGNFGFKGTWKAQGAAEVVGETGWENPDQNISTSAIQKSFTPLNVKSLAFFTGSDNLSNFLRTCGRFTSNQVGQIIKDLRNIDSALFKKLAAIKTGGLEEFVSAAGGSAKAMMNSQYGVTEIADYTKTPPGIVKIQ